MELNNWLESRFGSALTWEMNQDHGVWEVIARGLLFLFLLASTLVLIFLPPI